MTTVTLCTNIVYNIVYVYGEANEWNEIGYTEIPIPAEKEEKGAPGKHLQGSATDERESQANDQRLKTNIKTMPQSEVVNTSKMAPVHNRSKNKASKKVVRMSIVLVTLFIIAWTPTSVLIASYVISPWTVITISRKIPNLVSYFLS